MKRVLLIILSITALSLCGCDLIDTIFEDIGGWDLTACVHYPEACWEFYWDNTDQFSDGPTTP